MQVCAVLHVAHVVVRRVTVVIVHIGHEDVVVVIQFFVAIFCRDFLYQEMFSLQQHRRFLLSYSASCPLDKPISF